MKLNIYKDLETQAEILLDKETQLIKNSGWWRRDWNSGNRYFFKKSERNKLSSCDYTISDFIEHKSKKHNGKDYDSYLSEMFNKVNAYGFDWLKDEISWDHNRLGIHVSNNGYYYAWRDGFVKFRKEDFNYCDENNNLVHYVYEGRKRPSKYTVETEHKYYFTFSRPSNGRNKIIVHKQNSGTLSKETKEYYKQFNFEFIEHFYDFRNSKYVTKQPSHYCVTHEFDNVKDYKKFLAQQKQTRYYYQPKEYSFKYQKEVDDNVNIESKGFTKESFKINNKLTPTQRKHIIKLLNDKFDGIYTEYVFPKWYHTKYRDTEMVVVKLKLNDGFNSVTTQEFTQEQFVEILKIKKKIIMKQSQEIEYAKKYLHKCFKHNKKEQYIRIVNIEIDLNDGNLLKKGFNGEDRKFFYTIKMVKPTGIDMHLDCPTGMFLLGYNIYDYEEVSLREFLEYEASIIKKLQKFYTSNETSMSEILEYEEILNEASKIKDIGDIILDFSNGTIELSEVTSELENIVIFKEKYSKRLEKFKRKH